MFCLHVCLCHVHAVYPGRLHQISWNWNYRHLLAPCRCWMEPGSSRRAAGCLKSSRQPLKCVPVCVTTWGDRAQIPLELEYIQMVVSHWHGNWEPNSGLVLFTSSIPLLIFISELFKWGFAFLTSSTKYFSFILPTVGITGEYCYQAQLSYTFNNYMIIPEIPLCVWGGC